MKLKMKSSILTVLFVAAPQAFSMPHEGTSDGNKAECVPLGAKIVQCKPICVWVFNIIDNIITAGYCGGGEKCCQLCIGTHCLYVA